MTPPRSIIWAFLGCCMALSAGCSGEEPEPIQVRYGRLRGYSGQSSINGTAVIAKMFEQAGHRVSARSALTPVTRNADVIVWFPDSFQPPSAEVRRWLEDWLSDGFNRTLVYVGRDFDAEPLYWRKAIAKVPEDKRGPMRLRLNHAESRVASERARGLPKSEDKVGKKRANADAWFEFTPAAPEQSPKSLDGDWLAAIDPAKAEIELNDRLTVSEYDAPLLYCDQSVIASWVSRREFGDGQMIVVQNGSFLLNLALINHEHRRLAGQLIESVELQSGSECDIVFLESDEDGLPIQEQEPKVQPPTEADYPPPISDMLYHGIVLAIVVTIGSWPIFGRPRRLASPPLSDFGQHVESLGDLLRRSHDDDYCRDRVAQWQERERR